MPRVLTAVPPMPAAADGDIQGGGMRCRRVRGVGLRFVEPVVPEEPVGVIDGDALPDPRRRRLLDRGFTDR